MNKALLLPPLYVECEEHCQRRWKGLTDEAKASFGVSLSEVRGLLWHLWQKEFYLAMCLAYENNLRGGSDE